VVDNQGYTKFAFSSGHDRYLRIAAVHRAVYERLPAQRAIEF
jgi:hypothetical protein